MKRTVQTFLAMSLDRSVLHGPPLAARPMIVLQSFPADEINFFESYFFELFRNLYFVIQENKNVLRILLS